MPTLPVTFSLEPRFKEQFATFLEAGFSAFTAALRMWPNDPGLASMVARDWPTDPYVEAYRAKIVDDAEVKSKPATKTAQIKRIEERLQFFKADDYIKAERLIAEMSGHIEKAAPPSVTLTNVNQTVERVMVIRDHGTDEEWEAKAQRQQSKLIEHNT